MSENTKPEILELAQEMLKMSDEEFARSLIKTPTEKLALLGGVESLVLRAQTLMEKKADLFEKIRKEVKSEVA